MNLIGGIAFLALRVTGHKARRFHNALTVTVGKYWGGLSLGCFLLVNEGASKSLLTHEYGHSFQNIVFGPLFPFLIGIPSALRYWAREIESRRGKADLPAYEAIWFERQATRWGEKHAAP